MTSKISFFSLRIENIRHRAGMMLFIIFLHFLLFLSFIMNLQNMFMERRGEKYIEMIKKAAELVRLNANAGLAAFACGVLLAFSGFRYLHSRAKVDFYHSLPVERRKLFFLPVGNDFLLFVLAMGTLSAAECLAGMITGCFSTMFLLHVLVSFFCYVVVFGTAYVTMALAMILTGNSAVGLLAFAGFCGYFPLLIRGFYPFLAETFYNTYVSGTGWREEFLYLSPVSLAYGIMDQSAVWRGEWNLSYLAAACIWTALLLFLDCFLFKRRASEAAGKAAAFPGMKPVFRILLVVPLTVYAGMFLYTVSFTFWKPWILAGIVIGGFLVHGVIECIYQFDVRGLFSHKRQMLACMASSLAAVLFFWLDVTGYDNYIPQEERIESVVMDIPDQGLTESGFWGESREGLTGEEIPGFLKVMEEVVPQNDQNYHAYFHDRPVYDYAGAQTASGGGHYSTFRITYRLKNGGVKKREYILDDELQDKMMGQVFDCGGYRKSMYSLYTGDWSRVSDVEISWPVECREIKLGEEQKRKLFQAYLEDFSEFTYEEARTELPFGQMHLEVKNPDIGGGEYWSVSAWTDNYELYPSFKRTAACIREELGIDLRLYIKEKIQRLDIETYEEAEGKSVVNSITEREVIESVRKKLVYGSYMDSRAFSLDKSGALITAEIITAHGTEKIRVYTDAETVERLRNIGNRNGGVHEE